MGSELVSPESISRRLQVLVHIIVLAKQMIAVEVLAVKHHVTEPTLEVKTTLAFAPVSAQSA